jgi:chromate transporter
VKFLVLYALLLKATATSFAGLASLPVIRDELVVRHHMLTDHQLNAAVVVTRSTPGPVGVYVVSVGYFAGGIPGAIAGWLAMATPSLAIILLLRTFGARANHPRVRGLLEAVVIASSALLLSSAVPLARDALVDGVTCFIAAAGLVALVWRRIDSLWVIVAGAFVSLFASLASLPGAQ